MNFFTRNNSLFLAFAACLLQVDAFAQQTITGTVMSPYDQEPIAGALVSAAGKDEEKVTETDSLGNFTLEVNSLDGDLKVWSPGYYEVFIPILERTDIQVTMVPENRYNYYQTPGESPGKINKGQTIYRKDFKPGALYLEDVLQSAFPGLNVINKSGMPGEGSFINHRGIKTILADNSPLIVVNGVPYLPDMNISPVIGGYSRSVLSTINVNNVESITLLKGAEAAVWGSMGSNGVLLIETAKARDLETAIQYTGQYGVAMNTATLPVLGVEDFKRYIGDVGLTEYEDMGEMLELFPFLRDDPDYYFNFLYNNDTDWQSLIYEPALIADNNLNIKGGDAIAKYDLSVGVTSIGGALDNTRLTRYNTRLNANISLGKKTDFTSSIGFGYIKSRLHEQGLLEATNPVLTSLYKAPILNPYNKDEFNHELPTFDIVRQFNVSNPLAAVNDITMEMDAYDLFLNSGISHRLTPDLSISGLFGIYSGYNRQSGFISGKSSLSIVPLQEGVALNTARSGTGQTSNVYFNVNARYTKKSLSSGLGYQGLITRREFDAGSGRNTSSDFYTTLTYVESEGRSFNGYIDLWNWMSLYAFARYDFTKYLSATVNVSADGSSASGVDAQRFGVFPGGNINLNLKNMGFLKNSRPVDNLELIASHAITGNSRFSPRLGKQYYASQIYLQLSGIVSGNVANTSLTWEKSATSEVSINTALFGNKANLSVTGYNVQTTDVIIPQTTSPVFGGSHAFINSGEINNKGIELGFQLEVVEKRNFGVTLGGTVNKNISEVVSVGAEDQLITDLDEDGTMVSKPGEAPFSFYGHVAEGIFSSEAEATQAGLVDAKGDPFTAGDVRWRDVNNDSIIDINDRMIIGDPNPDLFGGFYVHVRYRDFSLSTYFNYSIGQQMYNATRRSMESMKNFYNQSSAVNRRWQSDGQETDVPKASYDDPMQNSRFSDRWIETGSYIRLNNITLNYRLKRFSNIIQGGNVYLTGENLFTASNYLGLDPVTAFSYDPMLQGVDYGKQPLPKTVKIGVNLVF